MPDPNIALQREKQAARRHDEYPGVTGDDNGNIYAAASRYYVRFPQGTDANGLTVYGAPRPVRYDGTGGIIAHADVEVLVRKDPYDGIETITRVVPDWWQRVNIDSRVTNPGEPVSKWWDSPNFIRWLNRPTGSSSGSAATKVTTRENPFYWNDAQDWAIFSGTMPADQLDLDSFIPATDTHRLVITYFDVLAGSVAAVGSTAQALTSALDLSDYLECRALLPHNECVPLTAYKLADDQSAIDKNAVYEELRSWIALPAVLGFPNPIASGTNWLLRDTHQQLCFNLTIEGQLTVEGSLTVI
jgi:hypothetical protein